MSWLCWSCGWLERRFEAPCSFFLVLPLLFWMTKNLITWIVPTVSLTGAMMIYCNYFKYYWDGKNFEEIPDSSIAVQPPWCPCRYLSFLVSTPSNQNEKQLNQDHPSSSSFGTFSVLFSSFKVLFSKCAEKMSVVRLVGLHLRAQQKATGNGNANAAQNTHNIHVVYDMIIYIYVCVWNIVKQIEMIWNLCTLFTLINILEAGGGWRKLAG